jgi:meiosis induction protein kinase IME2/SME1
MAPHSLETILQPPHWPASLAAFVTWCLMWDPKNRPTSAQAMAHEYFSDALDPLRPKAPAPRQLNRKNSNFDPKSSKETVESVPPATRTSWFRKSLISRESAPAVPQHIVSPQTISPHPSPIHTSSVPPPTLSPKPRPNASKRATWTNGTTPTVGAPMPILPSIRPISPLSNAVTAQARSTLISDASNHTSKAATGMEERGSKKIGRQLSVASHGNHYGDVPRQDTGSLSGNGIVSSPTSGQKEGFFSHLRKRARRLSGRHQLPLSPKYDDVEANAGCGPWQSNRSSVAFDPNATMESIPRNDFVELDKALHNVRYSLDASSQLSQSTQSTNYNSHKPSPGRALLSPTAKRHHSLQTLRPTEEVQPISGGPAPISSRTRRALQLSTHPAHRYETPDEEEELLDEALHSNHRSTRVLAGRSVTDFDSHRHVLVSKDMNRQTLHHSISNGAISNPYPTPSPSAKRNGILFTNSLMDEPATPVNIARGRPREDHTTLWPTPPYEENGWAASAAASIIAAGSQYR